MTGEKNRYKTLEKLAKLEDRALSTPAHDELTIKLLDKEYLKTKFPEIVNYFDEKEVRFYRRLDETELKQYYIKLNDTFKPSFDPWVLLSIQSEQPIKTKSGFIIGYWDIVISCTDSVGIPFLDDEIYVRFPKAPIYLIEVKPEINSFGETLRQINTYREFPFGRNEKIILFTPDLRFKNQFESQGISVVSP